MAFREDSKEYNPFKGKDRNQDLVTMICIIYLDNRIKEDGIQGKNKPDTVEPKAGNLEFVSHGKGNSDYMGNKNGVQ